MKPSSHEVTLLYQARKTFRGHRDPLTPLKGHRGGSCSVLLRARGLI